MSNHKTETVHIEVFPNIIVATNDYNYLQNILPNLQKINNPKSVNIRAIYSKQIEKKLLTQKLGLRVWYEQTDTGVKMIHRTYSAIITAVCEIDASHDFGTAEISYNREYKIFRNPREYLRALIQRALFNQNAALIHGAGAKTDGTTIYMGAHSDTGKTTTIRALIREGAEIYGDDGVIISENGIMYPYAQAIPRKKKIIFDKIPPLKREIVMEYEKFEIAEPARIDIAIFLERWNRNEVVENPDPKEIINKVLITTEQSFPLHPWPHGVLLSLDYALNKNYIEYHHYREKIVNALIDTARETYILRAKEPHDYYQQIKEILKR